MQTLDVAARSKADSVHGPGCHCINCTNGPGTHLTSERVVELEIDETIQEHLQEDEYIDENDDDLTDFMRDDEYRAGGDHGECIWRRQRR